MVKIFFLRSQKTSILKNTEWSEKMLLLIAKICPDYAATMIDKSAYPHRHKPSICYHGKSYTAIEKKGEKAYQLQHNAIKPIELCDYTKNKQNIDLKSITPWAEWIIITTNDKRFEYGYLMIAHLPGTQGSIVPHDKDISIHQSPTQSYTLQVKYIRELVGNYQNNGSQKIPSRNIPKSEDRFKKKTAELQERMKIYEKNRARKAAKKRTFKTWFLSQILRLYMRIYDAIILQKKYISILLERGWRLKFTRTFWRYGLAILSKIIRFLIMIVKKLTRKKCDITTRKKKQHHTSFKKNQPNHKHKEHEPPQRDPMIRRKLPSH